MLVALLVILGIAIVAIPAYQVGIRRGQELRDLLISRIITEDPDGFIYFIQSIKCIPKDGKASIRVEKRED